MPTVDQNISKRALDQMGDSPVPDEDVELLVRTAIKLLNEGGGVDVIKQALNSSQDPGQVVGQFMGQLIMQMGENMIEQLQIDPRAFLAKGGFLEEILDYLEEQLALPPEFSDQVYSEVVEMIKAVVMKPEPPNEVMGGQAPGMGGGLQGQGGMNVQ